MKVHPILVFSFLVFVLQSCNNFKSTHPQAELLNTTGATGMNEKSILNFSSAIDRSLNNYKKEYSLIYSSGDFSLYTEKYSEHNDGTLYKTTTNNGTASHTVKAYYFKNDSLILVKERTQVTGDNGQVFKDTRTYLRNHITFKIDSRTSTSAEALRVLPYLVVQAPDNKYTSENFSDDIAILEDALKGTGKFEMIFQNMATFPEARYIILKSKKQNNYTASILVKEKDALIDSLLNMPSVFKDEKIKFNWKVSDNEAIYVPVADTVTSANGLNK